MARNSQSKNQKSWILLSLILGIIGIGMIIAVLVTNTSSEEQDELTTTNQNSSTSQNTQEEHDQAILEEYGFWISIFGNEKPETTTLEDGTIVYELEGENAVSVLPSSSESIIRGSYGSSTEEELTLDGKSAFLITGRSQKDGTELTYLLIRNGDRVYYFRGDEEFLTAVRESVRFSTSKKLNENS